MSRAASRYGELAADTAAAEGAAEVVEDFYSYPIPPQTPEKQKASSEELA